MALKSIWVNWMSPVIKSFLPLLGWRFLQQWREASVCIWCWPRSVFIAQSHLSSSTCAISWKTPRSISKLEAPSLSSHVNRNSPTLSLCFQIFLLCFLKNPLISKWIFFLLIIRTLILTRDQQIYLANLFLILPLRLPNDVHPYERICFPGRNQFDIVLRRLYIRCTSFRLLHFEYFNSRRFLFFLSPCLLHSTTIIWTSIETVFDNVFDYLIKCFSTLQQVGKQKTIQSVRSLCLLTNHYYQPTGRVFRHQREFFLVKVKSISKELN